MSRCTVEFVGSLSPEDLVGETLQKPIFTAYRNRRTMYTYKPHLNHKILLKKTGDTKNPLINKRRDKTVSKATSNNLKRTTGNESKHKSTTVHKHMFTKSITEK